MLLLTKYTVLYKENEICCIILLSLPSRERGLKFFITDYKAVSHIVAPFAGAWIEIVDFGLCIPNGRSLPSRERGLKSIYRAHKCRRSKSLPSRERGLKFFISIYCID